MNVCALPLPNESVDLVLDKGCLDAFLSECPSHRCSGNNQEEQGDNPKIFRMFEELHRVLRPHGRIAILSGNDSFVVFPYLCADIPWRFTVTPVSCELSS